MQSARNFSTGCCLSSDVIYQRVKQITCASCQQVINVALQKPFTQIECPHCKAKLNVPAVLGPFLLLEVLGTGGMGAVYRAMDQSLGRFVAIKVMKRQLGADTKLVESFLREARAAAALNHANIVQIYSCGEQQGQPYIAMELVSGGRLDLLMEGGRSVEETRLLQTSLDVANGLAAANEVGLVHGDIKPANILYDKHGVAKIVDFGLAQFVNATQDKGEIWGTPYYISPERARGGKADHRSDIYSLGATMFHALTSKPPFDGPTASDVVVARLKMPVPDILEMRPDLHQETADLISRMMATDPTSRYPTSASLLSDMKRALEASKTALPAKKSQSKSQTGKISTSAEGAAAGKSKTPAIIGTLVAVAAIGGGAWWYLNSKKGDSAPQPPPAPIVVAPGPSPTTQQQGNTKPAPAAVDTKSEVFFKEDEQAFILTITKSAATPEKWMADLEAFAKASNIPQVSGRYMWLQVIGGLGQRYAGKEGEALVLWNDVAGRKLTSDEHPNQMPRVIARYLNIQWDEPQYTKYAELRAQWYRDFALLVRGTDLLQRKKFPEARTLLDQYVSAPVRPPAWPYALQSQIKTWLTTMEKFRTAGAEAKSRNDGAAISRAWDEAKRDLPELFRRLDPNNVLSDVGAGSPAAQKAAAESDQKIINTAFEAEKSGAMTKRDYTLAADNLVALNPKLTSREGRELLANLVNQLDRMDAVKNIIINGAKAKPFKERTDLGGDLTFADANGFKIGNQSRKWTEISNPTMTRVAAWYVETSGAENRKKADDLASIAIFCNLNGSTADAKKYAASARAADAGINAVLQKLAPGL